MDKAEYDYKIEVSEIRPLIGGDKFAAKAQYVVKRHPDGRTERINSPVGECFGKDADEARTKFEAAMQKWIREELH